MLLLTPSVAAIINNFPVIKTDFYTNIISERKQNCKSGYKMRLTENFNCLRKAVKFMIMKTEKMGQTRETWLLNTFFIVAVFCRFNISSWLRTFFLRLTILQTLKHENITINTLGANDLMFKILIFQLFQITLLQSLPLLRQEAARALVFALSSLLGSAVGLSKMLFLEYLGSQVHWFISS